MRVKLVVAYDGTDFSGWAVQAERCTIQGALTDAVLKVSGEVVEITGASRTDSGAHARGQVCHFDTRAPIEANKWLNILNRVLPDGIAVKDARFVGSDFHSRFFAEDRWYRYRIRTAGRDPFASRFAHDHNRPLDVTKMQVASSMLEGEHDYRAFTEELQPHIDNTVRTMRRVGVREAPNEVWIEIGGTAFLRGMMRRMSGALLEIGAGRREVRTIGDLLCERRAQMHWPVVLPAKGLCLMRVRYGPNPKDCREK